MAPNKIYHSFYARALVDAVIYLWLHDGHRTNQVMIVPAKQDQGSEDQASHSRQQDQPYQSARPPAS